MKNKKAFVFTLDAVIAIILLVSVMLMASSMLINKVETPQINYEQLHYSAQDSMEVLNRVSTLSEIGALWASGNCSTPTGRSECIDASNLAKNSLNNILPDTVGYRLLYGDDAIYISSSDRPSIDDSGGVAIANRVVSGFTKGREKEGFIARAYATKIDSRTTTRVYPFHPSGSGWQAKKFNVEKNFTLPLDANIINATLYVSINYGSQQAEPIFTELKINGVQRKTDIEWLYTQKEDFYESTAAFGLVTVASDLTTGENRIQLEIGSPHYNSHIHPGMYLMVEFETNHSFVDLGDVEIIEYFDYMKGDPGVWAVMPYHVPTNATDFSAHLHLEGESIYDYTNEYDEYGHYDVEIYVNSEEPIYINATPDANPVYDINLTNYTVLGTNAIAVYFNCYKDTAWGNKDTIIKPSSYIELNYTAHEDMQFGYGEIDITRNLAFGGNASNPKQLNFTIPEGVDPLIENFVHIAEGFTNLMNVSAWNPDSASEYSVFKSKSSRAVPTSVYIPPEKYKINSTNYVKLMDFYVNETTNQTETSPLNLILPWSRIEYTFLARVSVSYGAVFDNQTEAQEDATDRLEDKAEEYGIAIEDIEFANETLVTGKIPTLWGPVRFTLEVWQ